MVADSEMLYVKHILASIEKIEQYVEDVSFKTFLQDNKTQSAVIRELEIIGEAAKHLSKAFTKHIDLPWQDITGMRDKLIHDYMGVDPKVVWKTVKINLPELKKKLGQELALRVGGKL